MIQLGNLLFSFKRKRSEDCGSAQLLTSCCTFSGVRSEELRTENSPSSVELIAQDHDWKFSLSSTKWRTQKLSRFSFIKKMMIFDLFYFISTCDFFRLKFKEGKDTLLINKKPERCLPVKAVPGEILKFKGKKKKFPYNSIRLKEVCSVRVLFRQSRKDPWHPLVIRARSCSLREHRATWTLIFLQGWKREKKTYYFHFLKRFFTEKSERKQRWRKFSIDVRV